MRCTTRRRFSERLVWRAHVGAFPALEDEMIGMTLNGTYHGPGRSPDRVDALVWALTEAMLGRRAPEPGIRRL